MSWGDKWRKKGREREREFVCCGRWRSMKESIEATVMSMNGASFRIDVNWKHYDTLRSLHESFTLKQDLFIVFTRDECDSERAPRILFLSLSLSLYTSHFVPRSHNTICYINWKGIKPMSNGGNEMMFKLFFFPLLLLLLIFVACIVICTLVFVLYICFCWHLKRTKVL